MNPSLFTTQVQNGTIANHVKVYPIICHPCLWQHKFFLLHPTPKSHDHLGTLQMKKDKFPTKYKQLFLAWLLHFHKSLPFHKPQKQFLTFPRSICPFLFDLGLTKFFETSPCIFEMNYSLPIIYIATTRFSSSS